MPPRLIGAACIAITIAGPSSAFAQAPAATTIADRERVTIMRLSGIYDSQPPANFEAEVQIRRAIAKEYFRTHADDSDFLVVLTKFDYDLGTDSLGARVGGRYYSVKNDTRGIGLAEFDHAATFGSSGRLQGYIDIGVLSRLATDQTDPKFENTLSVLAHEFLHRWGTHVTFKEADGSISTALLGRDSSHWNFLLNSHNSLHYGNDWRDNGDGTFTSVGRSKAFFSPLDLYVMGMLDKDRVPPMTLLENPAIDPRRRSEVGVTITATPKAVTIDDIIAAEGERVPSAADAPKRFKIAYVYLIRPGEEADPLELAAINTIREAFATRFLILTNGQGVVEAFPRELTETPEPPEPVLPPSSGPRGTPVDLLEGLTWLVGRQTADGSWADSRWTRARDTATVVELTREYPSAFAASQRGLAWLTTAADASNVDTVARRMSALAPQFSAADTDFLNNARNASGGWGLLHGFRSDVLDSGLAIVALEQMTAADAAFLLTAQNTDGGWGMQPNGPSSILATTTVLALGPRGPPAEFTEALARGRTWLEARQNADGGFGDAGSTPAETAAAGLFLVNTDFAAARLDSALEYLRNTQLADGSWNESVHDTALALRALKRGDLANVLTDASSITFTPANPADGDTVTITATIGNATPRELQNVLVRIFDGNPSAGGVQIGDDISVASIAGRGDASVSVTWDTTNKPGQHQIFVGADADSRIEEFNEADNVASKTLAVKASPVQPDLRVTAADLVLAPAALLTLPQAQTVTVRLANAGTSPVQNATVWLYDGDPATGGTKIGETTASVGPRSNTAVPFSFQVATPADHRYVVLIDPLDQIAEADETNNRASVVLRMQPAVDLDVSPGTVTFSENPISRGKSITVSAQVGNQGTTDAFAVKVRFVLDDPAGALEIGTISLDVPAGQTRAASIVWLTSRTVTQVPVIVDVDPFHAVEETSENNNRASSLLSIVTAPGPNLRVTQTELVVPVLNQGGTATLTIPVHNTGASSAATVSVAFYLGVPGSGGVQIGATQMIPQIAADGQGTAAVTWNPIATAGNKLVYVVVDPANTIAELDESDNTAFVAVRVLSLPDLVVSGASISFTPPFPRQGDSIAITATIGNTGAQAAANVRVRFFTGGAPIGADQIVPVVAAGSTASVQVPLGTAPQAGRSQIDVQLDPANAVVESDETNNHASRTLGIQDGSIWLSNPYVSPNGDGVMDSTDVYFRVDASTPAAGLAVRDKYGSTVRSIALAAGEAAGSVTWDGRDDEGGVVADGRYTLVLTGGSGSELPSAAVTVDNNNSTIGDAAGTDFILGANLTCSAAGFQRTNSLFGSSVERFRTAGWLSDDSGLVQWVGSQDKCTQVVCNHFDLTIPHTFVENPVVGVYITSADGATRTRITPDSWGIHPPAGIGTHLDHVAVSPDGQKLLMTLRRYQAPGVGAWVNGNGQVAELWVMNRDGSGLMQLGSTPFSRVLTPDDPPDIIAQLTGYQPRWSPDSQRIAFIVPVISGADAMVVVVRHDGSDRKILARLGGASGSFWDLAWTPDGSRLLYSAWETGPPSEPVRARVHAINPDGTGASTLVVNSPYPDFPLARSWFPLTSLNGVQWMGNDRFIKVLSGAFEANGMFRPDPQFFLHQVWRFSTAGAFPKLLTPNVEWVDQVVVSPDGRAIAYNDRAAAAGGPAGVYNTWSKGLWIVEDEGPPQQLYDPTANAFVRHLPGGGSFLPSAGLANLEFSRDGRKLSFAEALYKTSSTLEFIFFHQAIRVIDLQDNSIRGLDFPVQPDESGRARWMLPLKALPHGASYLFAAIDVAGYVDAAGYNITALTAEHTSLVSVDLTDGRVTTLAVDDSLQFRREAGHNPYNFNFDLKLSPSGKVLLYKSFRESDGEASRCWKGYQEKDQYALTSLANLTAEFAFDRHRSQLEIKGIAQDLNFAEYRLDYAPVSPALQWAAIGVPSAVPVVNALLASWVPPSDGSFYVRLTATDLAGNEASSVKRITSGLTSTITNVSVAPRLFSPNGDGTTDSIAIAYLVLGPVHLEFQVFDSRNTLVRSFTQDHAVIGPASLAWDGRNAAGDRVADGTYRIHVLDYDFFVTSDTAPPDLGITLGSAVHTVPEKTQCSVTGRRQSCVTVPGPLLETPYHLMRGHATDVHFASWRLESGVGANPAEWAVLDAGAQPLIGADSLDTPIRRFDRPADVVGRRFRLTATDRAGNTTVLVSALAPEEIVLYAVDDGAVPTLRPVLHPLGAHRMSIQQTLRATPALLTLQYRLAGTPEWTTGPAVSVTAPRVDLPWDNTLLTAGKTYDLRMIGRDSQDASFASNVMQIRGNLFVLTSFDAKHHLTTGQVSLHEPLTQIKLVMAIDGDPAIGSGPPAYTDPISFTLGVASDPTLSVCERRLVPARYKGVGVSGAVYYSNTETIERHGSRPDTSCVKPTTLLTLTVQALQAADCAAPNPHKVRIRLTGTGVQSDTVTLSIQDKPYGLLKPIPNVTLPFEMDLPTHDRVEGRYVMSASASPLGSPTSPPVSTTASFVVDRTAPVAQLTYPGTAQQLCGVRTATQSILTIEGIAEDPNFDRYEVEFGEGPSPRFWTRIFPASLSDEGISRTPKRGPLVPWNITRLPRGTYSVKLKVWDRGGNVSCATVTFDVKGGLNVWSSEFEPQIISPNGDGRFDAAAMTFTLDVNAVADAKAYPIVAGQPAPNPIRTIFTRSSILAGADQVSWDGLTDAGMAAPDGRYRVALAAYDACDAATTVFADVLVDNTPPEALIASPRSTDEPGVAVDVTGSATDPYFDRYVLEVGNGDAPEAWTLLKSARTPVPDGLLGKWQTGGVPGLKTLRLTVSDLAGNERVTLVPVTIPDRQFIVTNFAAELAVFSPNGDRALDTVEITFTVARNAHVAVDVIDATETQVIRLFDGVMQAGAEETLTWNGTNTLGTPAFDGEYAIRITATASDDPTRIQVEKTEVSVDTAKPSLALTMPVDLGFVRSPLEILGTISDTHIESYQVSYLPATSAPPGVTLEEGTQNRVMASFGTLDLAGDSYLLTLSATDAARNTATRTFAFTVDNTAPQATLTAPVAGAVLGGAAPRVEVRGTITESNMDQWTLRFGAGTEPTSWLTIATAALAAPNDLLASWDVSSVPDGEGVLSLIVADKSGATTETRVPISIDNTRPTAVLTHPLDGARLTSAADILGTAADPNFKSARLDISQGTAETAFAFLPLVTIGHPVSSSTLFAWAALPPDGTYTLRLTVEDHGGLTAQTLATFAIDTQPPQPVALTAALEDRRSVRLNWTPSTDVALAGYQVYRNGTRIHVAAPDATSYLDANLGDGIHRYVVTVVDRVSLESPPSNQAQARIDLTPPLASILTPGNGASVAGLTEIRGTAAGPEFREYRVFVSVSASAQGFTLIQRSPAPMTSGVLARLDTVGYPHGTSLTLRLEADDLSGNVATDEVTVTIDNQPPQRPTLVSAVRSGANITVQWTTGGDSDLAGVFLYNNDVLANARRFVLNPALYLLTGTTYVDSGLPDGAYRYYAVAIDRAGNLSVASNVLTVTVESHPPRATIVQPATASKIDKATALVGATSDRDVVSFQFQYKPSTAGTWINVGAAATANPPEAIWDPSSLAFGSYDFRVVATDANGNTDPAPPFISLIHQDATPPAAPAALRAVVTADSVTLNWTGSADSDFASFSVYRRSGNGAPVKVSTSPLTTSSVIDQSVADGIYAYTVTSIDTSGNESDPSNVAAAQVYAPRLASFAACVTAIPTVSGAGAVAGSTVTLFVDAGQGPVQRATTTAAPDGTFAFPEVALVTGEATLSVRAVDASGNTSRTSVAVAVIAALRPGIPRGLSISVTGHDVTLMWDAPNEPVSGYRVSRDGFVWTTVTDTSFVDRALPDGHYTYFVSAFNAFGECGAESAVAQKTIAVGDVVAPAAPRDLTAVATESSVSLQWTANTEPDLAGYNVYRKQGPDWWVIDHPLLPAAVEAGLADGRYTYRVTAVDRAGNESAPSAEVQVNVGDPPPLQRPVFVYPTHAGHPLTLTVSGTPVAGVAVPGALVTVVRDGHSLGAAPARNSTWTTIFRLPSTPFGPAAFDSRTGLLAAVAPSVTTGARVLSLTDVFSTLTRTLTPASLADRVSLAPDASKVAYTTADGQHELHVFDLASNATVQTIPLPGAATWHAYSPDGRYIGVAIDDPSSGGNQIWLVDLAAPSPYQVTFEEGRLDHVAWSAQADKLAYVVDERVLRVIGVSGGFIADIDDVSPREPAFSPDGKTLAFVSAKTGSKEIWVHDFDAGTASPLPLDSTDVTDRGFPVFSPDGKELAYVQNIFGFYALGVHDFASGMTETTAYGVGLGVPFWTTAKMVVSVNSDMVFKSERPGHFSLPLVPLEPGLNVISAVATDVSGNESDPAEPLSLTRDSSSVPDIVVDRIAAYPALATAGTPVRLSVAIRNTSAVAAGAFTVALFDANEQGKSAAIGSPQVVNGLAPGAAVLLTVDWTATGVTGRHQVSVMVDPANALMEATKSNNYGEHEVVIVSSNVPSVRLTADRSSYGADESVRLTVDATNPAPAGNFTLTLSIQDASGQTAARILQESLTAWGYAARTFLTSWFTGDTAPGAYQAHARLTASDGRVFEGVVSFTIAGQQRVDVAVASDRASYTTDDLVSIRGTVVNESRNADAFALTAVTQVLDSAGAEVSRSESPMATVLAGTRVDLATSWTPSGAGSFTARFSVRSAAGELAARTTVFTVHGIEKIGGRLELTPAAVALGQPLSIDATIANTGTLGRNGVALRIVLQDPATDEIVQSHDRTVDLPVGASIPWRVSAPTQTLALKTYRVLLYAQLGSVKTLATASVTILDAEAPAVQITMPPGLFSNSPVSLAALVADSGSGVERVEYRIDQGPWQLLAIADPAAGRYGQTFPARPDTEGARTLTVRAFDHAGNGPDTSASDQNPVSATFMIDVTPPSIVITGVEEGVTYHAAVTPVIAVTDTNAVTRTMLLNGSPFISGTQVGQAGLYSLSVSATDAAGNTASKTVTFVIRLNEPPVATPESVTTAEDTSAQITLTASNPGGGPLTFTVTTPPASGVLTGDAPNLTYKPNLNFHGVDGFTFTVNDASSSSAPAIVSITVTPVNDPPIATVGPDQSVSEGDLVTLDGTGSSDPDGDAILYQWVQVAGAPVALSLAHPARPTFVAPNVSSGGDTLTFRLIVRDMADSAPAIVNVAVKNLNHPPVADAGRHQTVKEGSPVGLDGTASYDPDGDALSYSWTQTAGPGVHVSGADRASPSFTAPFIATTRITLTFELTVSDGVATSTDVVAITVENVNHPPVAKAGADQVKNERSLVTLDGSGSTDPDGDSLTYRWRQTSGPPVVLTGDSDATPSFKAPDVGSGGATLVFNLVVNDGSSDSAPDTVTIEVLRVAQGPVCTLAQPSPAILWPPDHKLVMVRIIGLSDPDGGGDDDDDDHGDDDDDDGNRGGDDEGKRRHKTSHSQDGHHHDRPGIRIVVFSVTQDEPVNGLGDGDTSPDAIIDGDKVLLRAERAGKGNGRVYRISFTATDSSGASCTGSVKVGVPQSMKPGSVAVDDGQRYDSTRKEYKW